MILLHGAAARREGCIPIIVMNWGSGTGDSDTTIYCLSMDRTARKGVNQHVRLGPES